jgi:hypothetical protein
MRLKQLSLAVGAGTIAVGKRLGAEVCLVAVGIGLARCTGPLEWRIGLGRWCGSGCGRGKADHGDGEGEDDGLERGHDDRFGWGVDW